MSFISASIKNLLNGVSQQNPITRNESQADEQVNAVSDPVQGIYKRPGSGVVVYQEIDNSNVASHVINYTNENRVQAVVCNGKVRLFDLTVGLEYRRFNGGEDFAFPLTTSDDILNGVMVDSPDSEFISSGSTPGNTAQTNSSYLGIGASPVIAGNRKQITVIEESTALSLYQFNSVDPQFPTYPYLDTPNNKEDLRFLTVEDYTFIVNRSIKPTFSPKFIQARQQSVSIAVPKVVPGLLYGSRFTINVDGNYFNYRYTMANEFPVQPGVFPDIPSDFGDTILQSLATSMRQVLTSRGYTVSIRDANEAEKSKFSFDAGDFKNRFYDKNSVDFTDTYPFHNKVIVLTKKTTLIDVLPYYSPTSVLFTAEKKPQRFFVLIKQGLSTIEYGFSVKRKDSNDPIVVSAYTTGRTDNPDSYKTNVIASALATKINQTTVAKAKILGQDIVVVEPKGDYEILFSVYDTWGGEALVSVIDTFPAESDLPPQFIPGVSAGVGDTPGYYVRYTGESFTFDNRDPIQTAGIASVSTRFNNPGNNNFPTNIKFTGYKYVDDQGRTLIVDYLLNGVNETLTIQNTGNRTDGKVAIRNNVNGALDRVYIGPEENRFSNQNPFEIANYVTSFSGKTLKLLVPENNDLITDQDNFWEESYKDGEISHMNPYSMPHAIVRDQTNTGLTLKIGSLQWADRLSGDEENFPSPSFNGDYIKDVFFFRNRLGFITESNIVFSAAGDFFRFYPKSSKTERDDDPIDIGISHTRQTKLQNIATFNGFLVVFSENTQFIVSSGNSSLFTLKTVDVKPSTGYNNSSICRPINSGQDLYFVADNRNHTTLYQYFLTANGVSNAAIDITSHVPTYIPKGVFRLAANEENRIVALASREDPSNIYIYKHLFDGEKKVQESISRWEFATDDSSYELIDLDIYSNFMTVSYLKTNPALVKPRVETITLDIGPYDPIKVLMDRQFTLETLNPVATLVQQGEDFRPVYMYDLSGLSVYFESVNGSTLKVVDNLRNELEVFAIQKNGDDLQIYVFDYGGPITIGLPYQMLYQFSPLLARDGSSETTVGAKNIIKTFTVYHKDANKFAVKISPVGRQDITYSYPKRLGLGLSNRKLDEYTVLVNSRAENHKITLVNDAVKNTVFTSASYEAQYSLNSNRIR